MKCPVEIGHEISRFAAGESRRAWPPVCCLNRRPAMERAIKVQAVISRAKAKKITRQAAEKNGGRDGAVEKTRGGKVKKPTFPPRLEIPQTPRGIPTFPQPLRLREINKNRTFHLLRKGDISNVVRMGTFLMSVDNYGILLLTFALYSPIMLPMKRAAAIDLAFGLCPGLAATKLAIIVGLGLGRPQETEGRVCAT